MAQRVHRIPHPAGTPEYQRVWRELSGYAEKRKAKWRELRILVLTHYAGGTPACSCCGEKTLEFLSFDHIEGGGNQHRKSIGRGWTLLRWLVVNQLPPGYQVLCHNCNQAKGYYGICPHQRQKAEVA